MESKQSAVLLITAKYQEKQIRVSYTTAQHNVDTRTQAKPLCPPQ